VSSECCVTSDFMVLYSIYIYIYFVTFLTLPFSELRLVGLALDLVDIPQSFSVGRVI